MQLSKTVSKKYMLWFSFREEKLSFESMDKLFHYKKNGKSIIDILIGMEDMKLCFDGKELEKIIDEELPDVKYFFGSLNDYFKAHNYPFKALQVANTACIVQTKRLFCFSHNKYITTESDLIEHRDCISKNYLHKTEQKELIKDIIVDDKDAATKKRLGKRLAEEIKARRDY